MVQRDFYLNRLIRNTWNGEIKVITGIRRCGKSVLLFDLFYNYLRSHGTAEDGIVRIELDQRRYYKYRNPIVLCEYIESIVTGASEKQFYLFIDEVQLTTKVVDKENGNIEVTIYDRSRQPQRSDNRLRTSESRHNLLLSHPDLLPNQQSHNVRGQKYLRF